jgi:predicted amidohydrolase YtcJ
VQIERGGCRDIPVLGQIVEARSPDLTTRRLTVEAAGVNMCFTMPRPIEGFDRGADVAIVGATIQTLDDERPTATALAWRDGVLTVVGEDADVRPHIGSRTEVIDGRRLAVVPGLVDSHIHPFVGTLRTRGVDLRSALTLNEVRNRLAVERERCGPGLWILGHSVRYEAFHDSGIRADVIADVVGDSPALLNFYDGHTALTNQPALALAGLTGARRFTEYAEVVCDSSGSPTGALLEEPAMRLVRDVVPAWTQAEQLSAFAETFRALNRVGLTGAHVMLGDPNLLEVCRTLEERGDLSVRLVMPMHQEPSISDDEVEERLRLASAHGRLWRVGTAKFFLDGVLDSGTAWLVDPGPGGVNGHPYWPDVGRYQELVRRFTQAGFNAATHAVGDGAVRGALDAYESAGPPHRGRHRIEHIETLMDEDLPRFASLGVTASMQPLHMEGLDDPTTPSSWVDGLSEGRYDRGFRARDLVDSGAIVALGSDWMVADYDPRIGMAWAQLRRKPQRPERVPYLPDQRLSADSVLRGYTTCPAMVIGDQDISGRLAPGLRADITAFAEDPARIPPDDLPDLPILLTVVDGAVVYRAGEAEGD